MTATLNSAGTTPVRSDVFTVVSSEISGRKQFCFSFISDVVTWEIKHKQNTETILKRFWIVSELFQAH